MRRMLVTTASVIALGLGGIGLASASDTNLGKPGTETATPPAASAQTQTRTKSERTTAMSTHRTTRMSRAEVIQAQRQLRVDHLYRGAIDGRFGPQTRIALRRFQEQNHLPATARLDGRTMASLMGGATGQMGQGTSRPPKATHTHALGATRLQHANQPTNAMGQGSSTQPNATQLTPPNGQMPNPTGTPPMPNNNAGAETNPNSQPNQK